jgi:hypothetical protein
MNFEDPFANDLNNFRSVAAGLRQTSSSPTAGSLSRGLGDATSLASPAAASPTARGQLGVTATELGAESPLLGSSTGGVSFFPPAANVAPVAGRRARGTPNTSSPLSTTPSAVPLSTQNTVAPFPPSPPPQQTQQGFFSPATRVPPPAPAAPSALSWLDDMDSASAPPAAGRRSDLVPLSTSPVVTAAAAAPPASTNMPLFLNFDAAEGMNDAAAPPLPLPQGTTPQNLANAAAAVASQNTAAAEAERKRRELRELYATLSALDAEQQRLEDRLDTRELREETELLTLETSVVGKKNELADKEEELTSKRAELASHTQERLAALSIRYAHEMDAQSAEVRALDGARFEKQLQQIHTQRTAAEEAVRVLREQAALALAIEPFSEKGVRVAVSEAVGAAATSTSPEHAAGDDGAEGRKGGGSVPYALLEAGLQKSVELLRAYCDQRMHHARESLVDYVHAETLEAAHSVRRKREQLWADDTFQHKALFGQYLTDMMQRYMVFYKERALLKQQNITALQEKLHSTATELRCCAAARLQKLLQDVTAKMALSTEHQTKSADEAKGRLQNQLSAVLEADRAMAVAQRKEVESRLLAEVQVQRQRFQAEERALQDQLQRLRQSNGTTAREGFQDLLDSLQASGPSRMQSLDEDVAELKARVMAKLHESASSSSVLAPRAASSATHMHAEELTHVIRRALAEEAARQQSMTLSRQRCCELRSELLQKMQEAAVERLQHIRCAQRAHQSRIDAQRRTWEAAHRQNLAAACSLILPISGSTTGTNDAQYVAETYAAPQDITSIALMDVVRDKLQSRDDARQRLLRFRKECAAQYFRLLEDVRTQREAVHTTWEDLWGAAQTQLTQQTASHETQLEVEKGLITVTSQLQTVERDHRNTERECRRVAEVTQRLKAEAAQCGVDDRLLCAPLELFTGVGGVFPPTSPPPAPPTATVLHTVDPSVINRLPTANKFTAVRTSANVAAAIGKADVPDLAAALPPFSAAVATTSLPSPPPSCSNAVDEEPVSMMASSRAQQPQQRGDSSNIVEMSNATATQPWSSALLRAEQLLSSSNADDAHAAAEGGCPVAAAAAAAEEGRQGGSTYEGRDSSNNISSLCLPQPGGGDDKISRDVSAARIGSSTSPSGTATEGIRRSSSSLRSTDAAPQLGSFTTWLDTDNSSQKQRQRLRVPSSSPWQLQRPQGRTRTGLDTWSTLEEFRSGMDRFASAIAELETSGEGTNFSFNDSTNFVDLLSCTDSPGSSYQTH